MLMAIVNVGTKQQTWKIILMIMISLIKAIKVENINLGNFFYFCTVLHCTVLTEVIFQVPLQL